MTRTTRRGGLPVPTMPGSACRRPPVTPTGDGERDGGRRGRDALAGLTPADVTERMARGQVNDVPEDASRTVTAIVRANVLTRFNAILGVLLGVIVVVGPPQDALFAGVLVSNALVGIVQELRAKRTLDRLAVVSAPRVHVRRATGTADLDVREIVLDDLIELRSGDQVVVDGLVIETRHLEINQALVTGEADPVAAAVGDLALSGSFVVAGEGLMRTTRVGRDAYARSLADQARRFTLVRSELRAGVDRILRLVTWAIVPTAVLVVGSQLRSHHDFPDALRSSVAAVGSMIPEGLVLLTSVAFAVGVVRLGRRRVLVQELAAIEGLARVDVVCVDKTGTLTEGDLQVTAVEHLGPSTLDVEAVLGALAAADPHPNASMAALGRAVPRVVGWRVGHSVPFSSTRKWSAADFGAHGAWVLGAPDVVAPGGHARAVRDVAADRAAAGARVLVLAEAPSGLDGDRLPVDAAPVALVLLEERVRASAADTVGFFASQGVTVKVISGDHPRTVAAVARRVGVPGADEPFDALDLPVDAALEDVMERYSVFGRVTPEQKQAMVRALQARGHVVAMTGDGVNDVLALKEADIGMAMGSGSTATRAVARIVLLDDSFEVVPAVVAEGRRVIANVERVANLFVTKTVYALLLALAVGVARVPFPFLPRHLTVISTLTIGVPGFFLALAPNAVRSRPGFVPRVLRFALPAGVVAATATFGAYVVARNEPGSSIVQARTTATIVLFLVGFWVLGLLARPITAARTTLLTSMAAAFLLVMVLPPARSFFGFEVPSLLLVLAAVGIAAIADAALELGWRISGWVHDHPTRTWPLRPAGR